MAKYELTIIINPDLEGEKRKTLVDKVKGWVEKAKGKVEKVNEWGKRPLAYLIKKHKEGFYYLFDLELKGEFTKELKKKLNLEEEIIRYLLIKVEPHSVPTKSGYVRGK